MPTCCWPACWLGPDRGGLFALCAGVFRSLSGAVLGPVSLAVITIYGVFLSAFRRAYLRRRFRTELLCCWLGLAVHKAVVYGLGLFWATLPWPAGRRRWGAWWEKWLPAHCYTRWSTPPAIWEVNHGTDKPAADFGVVLVFALILGLFGFRMYQLQIRDADPEDASLSTYTTWSRVTAARGEILDRNGNVLVTNRASYNLVFNNYVFYNSDSPNESLRRLTALLAERDIVYIEHFPVTMDKPYAYTFDQLDGTWQSYFPGLSQLPELDSDISAAQLMKQLRAATGSPTTGRIRRCAGWWALRYELELRSDLTTLPAYTLISDVDADSLSAILELIIPGLTVGVFHVREYTTSMPPIFWAMWGK